MDQLLHIAYTGLYAFIGVGLIVVTRGRIFGWIWAAALVVIGLLILSEPDLRD